MELLYFFESIRSGFLDTLFQLITFLGEETVFMAVGMIVFWCIDKYQGYYLLTTGFLGTILNQFLKILCRIPRPWVIDPQFTIVESAREAATGYSFPSGHTQSSVGLFAGVARWNKAAVVRILCIVACVLVPVSRMYLGVHTPLDVGVSIAAALLLVFGAYPLFQKAQHSPKTMYSIFICLFVISSVFLLYVRLHSFPMDIDPHNLQSALKNAYTLFGCMAGLLVVYTVDLRFTQFSTKAVWWAQILKAIGGIALVLLAKEGLRTPLDWMFHEHLMARSVRYFFMVIVGGVLWPMTFSKFEKLGQNRK